MTTEHNLINKNYKYCTQVEWQAFWLLGVKRSVSQFAASMNLSGFTEGRSCLNGFRYCPVKFDVGPILCPRDITYIRYGIQTIMRRQDVNTSTVNKSDKCPTTTCSNIIDKERPNGPAHVIYFTRPENLFVFIERLIGITWMYVSLCMNYVSTLNKSCLTFSLITISGVRA